MNKMFLHQTIEKVALMSEFSNVVTVHLVIHQQEEDLHIDFPFNKLEDDIDTVVAELIETLGMTEADKPRVKGMIEAQINTPLSFEPINNNDLMGGDDSSDDGLQNDPQYKALLEQQRHEMQALVARQLQEKRELAARIQNQALMMRSGQGPKVGFALPISPPGNHSSPVATLQSPTPQGQAFDDLISFD